MQLAKQYLDSFINQAQQKKWHVSLLKPLISCLDLTSLNDDDNEPIIQSLCAKAQTPLGPVAAVCVYPQFVALAKEQLQNTKIKIATVINFPHGNDDATTVAATTQQAIANGADEIDIVMPYQHYVAGQRASSPKVLSACKEVCGANIPMKVILETGELKHKELIAAASFDALNAGADFLKTSTGKVPTGATLEAAAVMLLAIKDFQHLRRIGFKASGGIRTPQQATEYYYLAETIMGEGWVTPETFRIGASSLLDALLN